MKNKRFATSVCAALCSLTVSTAANDLVPVIYWDYGFSVFLFSQVGIIFLEWGALTPFFKTVDKGHLLLWSFLANTASAILGCLWFVVLDAPFVIRSSEAVLETIPTLEQQIQGVFVVFVASFLTTIPIEASCLRILSRNSSEATLKKSLLASLTMNTISYLLLAGVYLAVALYTLI